MKYHTNLTLYSSIVVAECCRGYCGSVLWDYWCPAVAKRCILWIIMLCGTFLPLAKHCQAISLLISCAGLLFARTNIKWDDPVSYMFMVTENGWLGLIMIFCSQICLWTWHSRSSVDCNCSYCQLGLMWSVSCDFNQVWLWSASKMQVNTVKPCHHELV